MLLYTQDDPNLEDYNVDRRVKEFIEAVFDQVRGID